MDYLNGNKRCLKEIFDSVTDMCRYWGINLPTYTYRIKKGWSLKNTLTTLPNNTVINDSLTIKRYIKDGYYEC